MLKYLIVTCLLGSSLLAVPVTISGPIYAPDGVTLANGTITVTNPNFTASDGHFVGGTSHTYKITSGVFSQNFEPSTNSSPAFSYGVTYKLGSTSPIPCSWTVGTSSAAIPAVQTCPSAASSVPATNIALSQISIGGGSTGQCMIISAGVWSAQNCTQSWTISVNDIYNSNTGNIGFGGAPGNYKVDISQSGTLGTQRVWDQTASTGTTLLQVRAGAGQSTNHLFQVLDNTGVYQLFSSTFEGAVNTNVAAEISTLPGNFYSSFTTHSGGGGGSNDHALVTFDSFNTQKWKIAGVWNGVADFKILDPEAANAIRFQITKSTGAVVVPELGGGGPLYVCVDNVGTLYAKASCP